MAVADAGSRNAGSDIGTALPHCDVWRSAFAECDAADAVFAEIDAHAFTQADAFSNPESHALPFDSVSLASHYMTFGGRFRYFSTQTETSCAFRLEGLPILRRQIEFEVFIWVRFDFGKDALGIANVNQPKSFSELLAFRSLSV